MTAKTDNTARKNFDLYKTAAEAAAAVSEHCLHTDCRCCPHNDAPHGHIGCVTSWLYANAEKDVR